MSASLVGSEMCIRDSHSTAQSDHSEPVSRNDLLIRYGRTALQVERNTWWHRWKRKSRGGHDAVLLGLTAACQ
eukprot:1859242-Alexandrium_andersonii.AAC.1